MKSSTVGLALVLIVSIAVRAHADCPEGSRSVSESEQQAYLSMQQAIRAAIPPAPAGWSLKDPGAKVAPVAPKDACKGSDPSPGWYGIYTWDEQVKKNSARNLEQDKRLKAASAFTPEEQKEMDDYTRQAREIERKAVAVIRTSPDEAARLRAEARPFSGKANEVRKAHNDRVFPQLEAIRKEFAAEYVNPTVAVSIVVNEDDRQLDAKEPLQIPGTVKAFLNNDKKLELSFGQVPPATASGGIGKKPRTIWAEVSGDRQAAETIANLLGSSNLGSLAKK
jgi:hypothetical protein